MHRLHTANATFWPCRSFFKTYHNCETVAKKFSVPPDVTQTATVAKISQITAGNADYGLRDLIFTAFFVRVKILFSATHQSGSNNLVAHLLPIVLTCSSTHNLQVRITPTLRNPSVFKHSGKQQASPWGLGLHLLSLNSSNATTCRPRDGTHACSVAAGRGAGPPALTVSKERTSTRRPPPVSKMSTTQRQHLRKPTACFACLAMERTSRDIRQLVKLDGWICVVYAVHTGWLSADLSCQNPLSQHCYG